MERRIADTIAELERFMCTVDDALALPREAAAFVHGLLLATGARRGVEIGTSYGYSGLWMASALEKNGGTLVTIDRDAQKSEHARSAFRSSGLEAIVDVRTGTAGDILPGLDPPIDFVLSDADKENCIRYVELLESKLTDRAVILTDNTTTHADQLAAFLSWIRAHPRFRSTGVPVGNGMEMSVRITAGPSVVF